MFCKGLALPLLAKHDSELVINTPLAKRTPFVVFNGNRGFTRLPAVSMDDVKIICKCQVCTVNDVIMAAATGAFRRYGGDIRGDARLQGETKGNLDFKCLMMMGLLRPIDDSNRVSALANKILFVSCALPIDEPSPVERLSRVVQTCNNLKDKAYMAGVVGITNIASSAMPTPLLQKTVSETFSKHSVLISSIPAFSVPAKFPKGDGGQIVSEIHMVFPNCVPQMSMITYNGKVYANIVADPALYPEPSKLGECWVSAFKELVAAPGMSEEVRSSISCCTSHA